MQDLDTEDAELEYLKFCFDWVRQMLHTCDGALCDNYTGYQEHIMRETKVHVATKIARNIQESKMLRHVRHEGTQKAS